jgi:hypothetical protein
MHRIAARPSGTRSVPGSTQSAGAPVGPFRKGCYGRSCPKSTLFLVSARPGFGLSPSSPAPGNGGICHQGGLPSDSLTWMT